MNKEELYPKEKDFSCIIIDLWDDENSAYKLLEINNDELQVTIKEIRKILNVGEYLMVYNKNGETVEI